MKLNMGGDENRSLRINFAKPAFIEKPEGKNRVLEVPMA